MIEEIVCLHQFIRPDKLSIYNHSKGNCYECIKHEDNKKCKGYYHIKIIKIYINENE